MPPSQGQVLAGGPGHRWAAAAPRAPPAPCRPHQVGAGPLSAAWRDPWPREPQTGGSGSGRRQSQPSAQRGNGQQAQTGLSHHLAALGSAGAAGLAAKASGVQSPARVPSPGPDLHLLQRRKAGVLHHRAGGDAKRVGGAEQVGGDGRAPCLLLGQRGLHDEAFPTAAAAPRASVLLEDRKQRVRAGAGGSHHGQRRARPSSRLGVAGEGSSFRARSRDGLSLGFSTQTCGVSGMAGGTERREDTGSNDGGVWTETHLGDRKGQMPQDRTGVQTSARQGTQHSRATHALPAQISHRSQLLQTQRRELDDGGPRTHSQPPAVSSALQRL